MDQLKEYYERTSDRFLDPGCGMGGRDFVIYPLLENLSGHLVEYGCGAGSLLLGLALEHRFSRVCGIDISEKALAALRGTSKARALSPGKLVLHQPEGDLLPFIESNSIDALDCVATVEHVLNPYLLLDELYRVAKPGATLICSAPNYGYIKHRLALLRVALPKTGTDELGENWRHAEWNAMHLHAFTKESFSILLNDCGWQPKKWTGWGDRFNWLSRWRRSYPGLLSGEIIAVCSKF